MVAAEAMMRGTSVIASDSGGLKELVGDKGVCVAPNDVAQLSRAILEAFRHPERTQRMGEEARAFALAELSQEVYVNKIEAILDQLVSARRSARVAQSESISVNSL
jgi:glycosyltransferase involved in cell wall biosynthesis